MSTTIKAPYRRLLAITVIELLGNMSPQEAQIELIEELLLSMIICQTHRVYEQHLSAKEQLCLMLIAKGKAYVCIARLMSTTVPQVMEYCSAILKKLRCDSLEQAVFEYVCYYGMQREYKN